MAVYVFGSRAGHTATPTSDVDVAVLFRSDALPDGKEQLSLREDLTAHLGIEADLIVMNRANPVLLHQIFKKGQLVINRNHKELNKLFARALVDYADLKITRAPIEKALAGGQTHG